MAYSDSEVEQGLYSSEGEYVEARPAFGAGLGRILRSVVPMAALGSAVFTVGAYGVAHLRGSSSAQMTRTRGTPQVKADAVLLHNASVARLPKPVVRDPAAPAADAPAPLGVPNKRRVPSKPKENLKPEEHMHDGNPCDDSEELLAGLCYTKCSILTGVPTAHRVTAFSCCTTDDCHGNVFKMKTVSMLPCHGFDVSSADGGKACPHEEGVCLDDEEQFTGSCYEKCSLLTNGKFPKRIGGASCCNPDAAGGCMNIWNDRTMPKLDVGGGKGDHDASTPKGPHFPLKSVTEA